MECYSEESEREVTEDHCWEIINDENITERINNEIDERDEELFLKLICNYPAIYNPQNKAYSNRLLKETAFENIARSLQTNGKL